MKQDNKNIFCSVSSGYSSVLMAIMMPKWYPDHNIIYAMANTSKEREESLKFMDECDKHFNLNMTWIEAIIHQEKGKGTDYKVTNFENLKRNGEVFEEGIKKYGIPNKANKWCNRDMKLVPLKKYADNIFGLNNYSIAVGIRADEIDRVSSKYRENNVFYPLIDNKVDTKYRNKFWKDQPIKIEIPAYKGNCDMCFEKSNRKLMTILKEEPDRGKWWSKMVEKYGQIELEGKNSYNWAINEYGRNSFYREYNTIEDLVKLAERPFHKATDEYVYENDLFDLEGDCGSGCQVF